MKLHLESNLDYQLAAIESVCDLFRGQENEHVPRRQCNAESVAPKH